MKTLTIFLLGLVFCVNFGAIEVFAQEKSFIISSASVTNACLDKIVLTNSGINVNKDFHICPQSDSLINSSTDGQTYATTLGGRTLRDKIWFFAGTSKDEAGNIKRIVKKHECNRPFNPPVFCGIENMERPERASNWYAFQIGDVGKHTINAEDFSSAPLDRLFLAGTQDTAGANDYLAFALNEESDPTGAKATIFTNPANKAILGGSLSRDGGMAVQLSATSAAWTLSTRKLNNGLPSKAPYAWTVPAYAGYSLDISDPIEVNSGVAGVSAVKIRYLVYRQFRGIGTAAQQSQIMIQRIDDATGKPMEAAKPLTVLKNAFQATAEAFQSLAIAPNAEVLLFTEYSGACKKMILKAVRLVNGTVSGPAKVLAGCSGLKESPIGYLGLDIMEEIEPES